MKFIVAAAGGFEQLTSLSAAATLTVPTGARGALIQAEAQNVRWRADGSAPTSSVGHILYATGVPLEISVSKEDPASGLAAMKFIEVTSGGKLNISYYF